MSFVQSTESNNTNDGSATTVSTVAFASSSAAGSAICGLIGWSGNSPNELTSVTDGTNTYAIVDRTTINGTSFRICSFVAQGIAAGGPYVVTGNLSVARTFRRAFAREDADVATTGQPNANSVNTSSTFGTGTDAVTSNSDTTTVDGCTIIGYGYNDSNTTIPSAGTGFTSRDSATYSAGSAYRTEDLVQSAAGSIAATFTHANGTDHLVSFMLALAPAEASSIVLPPVTMRPMLPGGMRRRR